MFIEDLESYDKLKNREPFSFKCKSCNKTLTLKKADNNKGKESQKLFLCPTCKKKRTCLEHFGVENPMKSLQVKETLKASFKEKYGVEHPLQLDTFKKKVQNTLLEKYGVTAFAKSDSFKEQIKEIWENKTDQELQDILDRRSKTKLEVYGDSQFNNRDKAKATLLERYGVENIMQLPEMQEYFSLLWSGKDDFTKETWDFKSDEEKETLSGKLRQAWNNKTPEERKEIRRKANKFQSYKSTDGETFDSNWELKYYEYCKSKGYEIIREPVELEFEFEGKTRYYYPDFSVNGELVEVKGSQFFEDGKMINPYNRKEDSLYEAKRQCALKNNVTILSQKELEDLGIKL